MSNLTLNPTPIWHDNINQVEVTEPILGGDGGNANLATRQLAENMLWLKKKVDALTSKTVEAYAIGDLYVTTIAHANAEAVKTHVGYGTWARHAEGQALVGLTANQAQNPAWTKTMGGVFGEYKHKLTVAETPAHGHVSGGNAVEADLRMVDPSRVSFDSINVKIAVIGAPNAAAGNTGGDQEHDIVQPSKIIGVWVRTA